MKKGKNIAIFASHNGSNLNAIIHASKQKVIDSTVCLVISNNHDALALVKAQKNNIPNYVINSKTVDNVESAMLNLLVKYDIDLIFLAGYLKKIDDSILKKYNNCILNIHPSLLPKYGGKGMYGINIHNAVIDAKEPYTGVSVHMVNEEYDSGKIIVQKQIKVSTDDTPQSLQEKVLELEHMIIVDVLKKIENNIILL